MFSGDCTCYLQCRIVLGTAYYHLYLKTITILVSVKCISLVSLFCISLMTKDDKYVFHVLNEHSSICVNF